MYKVTENFKSDTNKSNTRTYNNNYSEESWQERQAREREIAYDTMEEMTTKIQDDGKLFQKYLDIQSRFEKHSVGNCLIILKNNPNVTQFRDKKTWENLGVNLLPNPKSITILEPYKSKTNEVIYYNPKKVYDISQTNSKAKAEKVYSNNEIAQGFVHDCYAEIEVVDTLPDGTLGAYYDKEKNIVYACRGIDETLSLQTISQEIANVEMRTEDEGNLKDFKSYCISYMLCKKYGVDVSNYDFSQLPEELKTKEKGSEIRVELEQMRKNFKKINDRVTEYFEQNFKERRNEMQER